MSCAAFVSHTFAVRTAAHLAHLTSTSYAQHMALGDFYEGIIPLIDRFAEVYTGYEQEIPRYPRVATLDYDDPVELIDDYLDLVRQEMKGDARSSQAMMNTLAEIEELADQTAYKLRFLK